MDLNKLTKVVKYEITDDGFVFYGENGNVPDPSVAYWDGDLNLYRCEGKPCSEGLPEVVDGDLWSYAYTSNSLKGLPKIVNGHLTLNYYKGRSLKGLPEVVNGMLSLDSYQGHNFKNLPKEYVGLYINDRWYTKAEFDEYIKTERLVVKYKTTDDGFIFYDENGNVPDPQNAYWEGDLNLESYQGKSLKGLPNVVKGYLWLNLYKGNDYKNLPKEYAVIHINGYWRTKTEMDRFLNL